MPSSPATAPKISVTVNSVIIPVVVRDAQGNPIGDLTKGDFELLDNGKPRSITGFTIQHRAASSAGNEPAAISSPAPAAPSASPGAAPPVQRFIVFLFDNVHLEVADLGAMQQAAAKVLDESLADGDMAAMVALSGPNTGLTRDHGKLRDFLKSIQLQRTTRHDDRACPNITYYQADLIENKRSQSALETAEADYISCAHIVMPSMEMVETFVRATAVQELSVGDHDVYTSLYGIREIVERMGELPGERILVLISPGFLTQTPAALSEKSRVLDAAAQAKVTISAIDARGLYTTNLDASHSGESSLRGSLTGEHAQYHAASMALSEDVMAELAEGTGGAFFHNSNDLTGGLKRLVAAPDSIYLLEISLDGVKQNGSYHPLKVKVNRGGVDIKARRGYFAPKKPK
ncbi:MAG TPA: VWA domain-containing protein [Dongiaceae bacterium]|nr:VWA domain-containing protein [Dongiaceae bacterium]